MNGVYSGFIPILIYSTFTGSSEPPSIDILTEDGDILMTEDGQILITET